MILLWFFLVVSSIIPSGTSNEHTVEQTDSGTEQYRASIDDDEEAIVSAVGRETRSSLEDGRQKSGVGEAGLTRREMGSVQEASSGTDWGGLLLRLAATQVRMYVCMYVWTRRAMIKSFCDVRQPDRSIFFRFAGFIEK